MEQHQDGIANGRCPTTLGDSQWQRFQSGEPAHHKGFNFGHTVSESDFERSVKSFLTFEILNFLRNFKPVNKVDKN